ncbi:hypothetical protein [Planctomicrobium sp. SH664]|uniref:hypothetical protein n=1 Tax=Planctomicrobium sp. SH664 TaxID=3448125 RepID=UPI003F5C864E
MIQFIPARGMRLGLASMATALLLAGCGGGDVELGAVHGKITLDGQPLKHASVVFVPETGRAAMGGTDENGEYKLAYSATASGALVGPMTVEIRAGNPDGTRKEPVPSKYNTQSELRTEVKPGDNEINFDLQSK